MMSKKSVLFILGNYYPEPTGIGRFNNEMIDWMADHSYECVVVTTYPYYPHWKVQKPYSRKKWWYAKEIKKTANNNSITIYRCPHFIPAEITGKSRVISDFTFFVAVFFRLILKLGQKFDYVMNVSPPLAPGLLAVWYKRLKKAKMIYHVQDLQAEAAKELHIVDSKKFIDFILRLERHIIEQADVVSSISKGMALKVRQKTSKPVTLFPNWTDTNAFYPLPNRSSIKQEYGFSAADKIILYSGAIGEKQGLDIILNVAEKFMGRPENKFIICGTGPYKLKLELSAKAKNLSNVIFMPLQSEEKLNRFLNMADVHLVVQKAGIADLMMPSKLANIMAVGGLPLVTVNGVSELYLLLKNNCLAVLAKPENEKDILEKMEACLALQYTHIGQNARAYAEQFLSADAVLPRYVNAVFN